MRPIVAALAALGGGVILSAFVVSVARGDGPEAQWLLLGPMPFWLIGLIGYLRQPGRPVVWWLHLSESSVEKHVNAIFTKLGLSSEQLSHRRVTAVLTFLRDAGLRG